MKRAAIRTTASLVLLLPCLAGLTGACAQDGCDTVKGKYRFQYTLSAGQCVRTLEAIVDIGTASSSDPECTARETTTEDSSSCRVDRTESCNDGRSMTGVINCEDDGAKCGGTISVSQASGATCIYDISATRL